MSLIATGVLADAKAIGEVVRRVSPGTLCVLDGVCSVASEEIRMDDWGMDVVRLPFYSPLPFFQQPNSNYDLLRSSLVLKRVCRHPPVYR